MIETASSTYDVGGVKLQRPFKVRRLGHFGFNAIRMAECVKFYTELVGFRISDRIDFAARAPKPEELAEFGDTNGYFMHHGTEHHSFVLFNKRVREALDQHRRFAPGVTINQMSWHCGGLEEIVNGNDWIGAQGLEIQRAGRDMPGSNWHTYFYDPDGHTNELFYGMEQIGWEGKSKPQVMYDRRFAEKASLPQMSEEDEIRDAVARGVDIFSGFAYHDDGARTYNVEGVLLPRPFKVTRMGPINMFVSDYAASKEYYQRIMGFTLTEEVTWQGHTCAFLRANTEHHSMALYPIALREKLGLRADTTIMSFGLQVPTYRQLRAARTFLAEQGASIVEIPSELHPGIDYAFHVLDPDGHCLQFYFNMEQIGWDGRPRPAAARPQVKQSAWPETLEAQPDTFAGEVFLGPLG